MLLRMFVVVVHLAASKHYIEGQNFYRKTCSLVHRLRNMDKEPLSIVLFRLVSKNDLVFFCFIVLNVLLYVMYVQLILEVTDIRRSLQVSENKLSIFPLLKLTVMLRQSMDTQMPELTASAQLLD